MIDQALGSQVMLGLEFKVQANHFLQLRTKPIFYRRRVSESPGIERTIQFDPDQAVGKRTKPIVECDEFPLNIHNI